MSAIAPGSPRGQVKERHGMYRGAPTNGRIPEESLMALLRDLMGPAARRLGDAPGVREVEFAAITVSDAIRRDMRAAAAQARGARVVLGIGSEIVLDALALVRVAARLRHRA